MKSFLLITAHNSSFAYLPCVCSYHTIYTPVYSNPWSRTRNFL